MELTPSQLEFHYEKREEYDADQRLRFVTDLRAVLAGSFGDKEGAKHAKAHLKTLLSAAGYTS